MATYIQALREERRALAEAEDGPRFLGLIPERWLDEPTWKCVKGHVSRRILMSEVRGDLCLSCFEPALLFPPETREAPDAD